MSRPWELAAGGRAVEVEPEWLAGFLDRFAAGHGGAVATTVTPHQVDITAVNGWTASVSVPFGSLSAQSGQLRCPFGGRMVSSNEVRGSGIPVAIGYMRSARSMLAWAEDDIDAFP